MTNTELVKRLLNVLNYDTLYVQGGQGQPLNVVNKSRFIANYSYNKRPEREEEIRKADKETYAFDCIGVIKSVLWGWNASPNASMGGAKYASNGVPDISEDRLILLCHPSTDFSNICEGAYLWMQGHCGIYHNGYAIECTPKWKDGVQLTVCANHPLNATGYARKWTKWGKLPYITYKEEEVKKELKVLIDGQIKTVTAIENGNENYVRLRDMDEKLGICKVGYDTTKKIPTIGK